MTGLLMLAPVFMEYTPGTDMMSSIKFGAMRMSFVGSAELQGPQPLLPFFFQRIELTLGGTVLFNRLLDIPDKKNQPFFSLIAMGKDGKWLAARGRGGGLAIWIKE